MATYIRPGIYIQNYEDLVDEEVSLSASSTSSSNTSYRHKVNELYLDMLATQMGIKNYVEPSKKRIQELIVEALDMPKRQKHAPIIEFTDEEFEI